MLIFIKKSDARENRMEKKEKRRREREKLIFFHLNVVALSSFSVSFPHVFDKKNEKKKNRHCQSLGIDFSRTFIRKEKKPEREKNYRRKNESTSNNNDR